jgi:hypothetical protein
MKQRVKMFNSLWSHTSVEKQVNEFLSIATIEVIDIQYRMSFGNYGAMVVYRKKTD